LSLPTDLLLYFSNSILGSDHSLNFKLLHYGIMATDKGKLMAKLPAVTVWAACFSIITGMLREFSRFRQNHPIHQAMMRRFFRQTRSIPDNC
jgi:hypothetical protein